MFERKNHRKKNSEKVMAD